MDVALVLLLFVLLCTDGAVLLVSVRRYYSSVVLHTALHNMVFMAWFISSMTSVVSRSFFQASSLFFLITN